MSNVGGDGTMSSPGYCCERMRDAVDGWRDQCQTHQHAHECPDALIERRPDGTHGIIVHDGGSSMIEIDRCPWCRADLRTPGMIDEASRREIIDQIGDILASGIITMSGAEFDDLDLATLRLLLTDVRHVVGLRPCNTRKAGE